MSGSDGMATLHLMVGLPGSGKTTRARALAASTGAIRLTPDDWHTALYGNDMHHPDHDRIHDTIERLMWQLAEDLLKRDIDVILDFGFWSRAERDDFRDRARSLGVACRIDYAELSSDVLAERVRVRNASARQGVFVIGPDALAAWATLFEPPDADELALNPRADSRGGSNLGGTN
jgi:predicted kinase